MTLTPDDERADREHVGPPEIRSSRSTVGPALVIALCLAVAAVVVVWAVRDDDLPGERADLGAQGDSSTALHDDAVRLVRRDDGLFVEIDMPTPAPSSYEYPTSDLVPPDTPPHPPVSPGASAVPEVFTAWLFAFNDPASCTFASCDTDDLGAETAAQGGSYQLDGRIGDGDRLRFVGTVRLGQSPSGGAMLVNPIGAEVHVAIAPHGRLLADADLWRQLNGPIGSPEFWWGAAFLP